MRLFFLIVLLFVSSIPVSGGQAAEEILPLPRFVTIRPQEANARSGPSVNYPILWVYRQAGLPVEVVNQYEGWRKVRDIDGQGGWINKSLLSGNRNGIISADRPVSLRAHPDKNAPVVAIIEPRVVFDLLKCKENWCEIKKADFYGWIERKFIWGIYPNEQIN